MPDDPGLFDGHVWPMYLKHRRLMEDNGLNIGKIQKSLDITNYLFFMPLIISRIQANNPTTYLVVLMYLLKLCLTPLHMCCRLC